MSWFAFALSYAGLTLLAFAMTVHHRTVFGRAPEPRSVRTYRVAGWAHIAFALAASLVALGWQVGLIAWVCMLGASGFVLTQFLSFAPRFALAPAAGLLLSAVLVSALS
ncbi:MAG TPA: DUF3325 domain-containing protein [Opitutaceae bacterium]